MEDKHQNWRLQKTPSNPNPIQLRAVPTIIVQPPRWQNTDGSWVYGDPSTVVLNYVWEGSPEKLHQAINGAIRAYVSTLHKKEAAGDVRNAEIPPARGFGATETPTPAPSGFGQQIIPPPLKLPLDDEPERDRDRQPARDRNNVGAKREILIVTDKDLVSSEEQDESVMEVAQEMQPDPPVPIRRVDVKDLRRGLAVKADELPVVMLVDGNDVIQRKPVPMKKGWGPGISFWLLAGRAVDMFGTLAIWVVVIIVGLVCILMPLAAFGLAVYMTIVWLRNRKQAVQVVYQPAPSAAAATVAAQTAAVLQPAAPAAAAVPAAT
jgi:hypothetical protein